jgi:hypothetical protein
MIDRGQRKDRAVFFAGAVLTVFVILYTSLFIASHLTRSSENRRAIYPGDFTRIEVSVSGTATVTGTSASSVHADWDLSWSLFRPHVEKEIDGSTLRLSVSCSSVPGRDCASSVVLSVPSRAAVSVSAAGGVQATDVQGGLKARTRDGQVHLRDVKGAVDLGTRGGSINAEGLAGGELQATSRDGSMKLVFSGPPRSVAVATRDGRASLALPPVTDGYALKINRRGGSEHVAIASNPQSSRTITLRSRDGDLSIQQTTSVD